MVLGGAVALAAATGVLGVIQVVDTDVRAALAAQAAEAGVPANQHVVCTLGGAANYPALVYCSGGRSGWLVFDTDVGTAMVQQGLVDVPLTFPGGGAVQIEADLPGALLWLEGDDARLADGDVVDWPARTGQLGIVPATCGAPHAGAVVNGHGGVDFESAIASMISLGVVKAQASDLTLTAVTFEECGYETGVEPCVGREYMARSYDAGQIDHVDIAFPQMPNFGDSYAQAGHFDGVADGETVPPAGGGWHHYQLPNFRGVLNRTLARTGLQVKTWALGVDRGGLARARYYVNGKRAGRNSRYTQRPLNDLTIGGSIGGTVPGECDVPDVTGYEGTVYSFVLHDRALTEAEILHLHAQAMERFAIPTWPPAGIDDPQTILGSSLVAWYDATDPFWLEYSEQRVVQAMGNRVNPETHVASKFGSPLYLVDDTGGRGSVRVTTTPAAAGLRADTVATVLWPGGVATGAVTFIVAAHACSEAGFESAGGPFMAAGSETRTLPRIDMAIFAPGGATPYDRCVQLDDAGTSRNAQHNADPGSTVHMFVCKQDESTDVPTTQIDGTLTTGSTVNLGVAHLDTWTLGPRRSNGAYTGNGAGCGRIYMGLVVSGVVTAPQLTALRTYFQAVVGTA